jgi:hypothetical protein
LSAENISIVITSFLCQNTEGVLVCKHNSILIFSYLIFVLPYQK